MNKRGLLIVLSGPSGVGKGTVLRSYLEKNPNTRLSVSATTRQPRMGEVNGVHYYFLTEKENKKKVEQNEMLEYATYSGNRYGTPGGPVKEMLEDGHDVILEIEVQGAMQIKKSCPDAIFIFIIPPNMAELTHRLVDRKTEDDETIRRRLERSHAEIAMAHEYDYVVINDTIDNALEKLEAIVCAQKCSMSHMKEFVEEVLEDA